MTRTTPKRLANAPAASGRPKLADTGSRIFSARDAAEFRVAARRITRELVADPAAAKAFLIQSGFLNKSGKLAAPYRATRKV